ncbi:hypothetical protein ACO2Q1_01685 [Brevundimonas sp. VNH65]|uniref:hypothetical protein n=1 Tax=Brevundimonas sp. VNH65 TaxID=3400917 RepID=UPI003C04156F
MTASPPTPEPETAPKAPTRWRRAAILATGVALVLGALTVAWLVFLAPAFRVSPTLEHEATTSIVEFEVLERPETVWNLPEKTALLPGIENDEPVTIEKALGLGPLVMPRGTSVRVVRLRGAPLALRIEGTDGEPPYLLDATGRTELPVGSRIQVGRPGLTTGASGPTEGCPAPLPHLTFRASGSTIVGAPVAFDAFDDPETLAFFTPEQFADRMQPPMLEAGRVTVFGRTLIRKETYRADQFDLQAGDVVRIPPPSAKTGASGEFILQVSGCEPLRVYGLASAHGMSILRMGGDATEIRLSAWHIVTREPTVSFVLSFVALLVAVLTGIKAYDDVRKIWIRCWRARAERPKGGAGDPGGSEDVP